MEAHCEIIEDKGKKLVKVVLDPDPDDIGDRLLADMLNQHPAFLKGVPIEDVT